MKTSCLAFIFCFLFCDVGAQNLATHFTSFSQYYRCGDVTVTGTHLTVEALVKIDGTGPFAIGQSANDIVSKHNGAGDANYILRPDHCEISTTTGHYITSVAGFTSFIKDSFYHVAMTYDGSTLKFYVNGCLYTQTGVTGNLITNSYTTTIGQLASNPTALTIEQLYGYADEIRIWSVTRTQTEISNNMKDLPNPVSQTGLLAYYKFEGNSNNIQGNSAYNAIPFGSPSITAQDGFDRIKNFNAQYSIQNPSCGGTDGSIAAFAQGGKSPYQYSINGGSYQSSNTFNGLAAGAYTISVKSDGIGCSKDTTITLVSVTGPCDSVKITGPDKICSRTDTLTYSIYKSPNCTQQYSLQVDNAFADIILQTPTSLKLVFKQNGTTLIKVAYANSCKSVIDSLTVNIKFSPSPINLGPDITTCKDTSFTLNAGEGFVSYLWQNGTTDSTLVITLPGSYNVSTQNFCGAQFFDTLIYIKKTRVPFSVQPLSATACKGDSVLFTASGGTNYAWSPAGNFKSPVSSSSKALINATQDFTVTINDPVCVRDTLVTIPVVALQSAIISVSKSNDVSCGNDSAVLVANGGLSYTWSPNLYISRNNGDHITVKPTQSFTYYVQGRDVAGCVGQDSVTVNFLKEGIQKFFTPTAFTPNGDGLNDVFRPTFIGPAAKYDFRVYNRWGQLVFHSKKTGEGWDGMFNGTKAKTDVYVFYITAEGTCNGKFEQKGTVALIR